MKNRNSIQLIYDVRRARFRYYGNGERIALFQNFVLFDLVLGSCMIILFENESNDKINDASQTIFSVFIYLFLTSSFAFPPLNTRPYSCYSLHAVHDSCDSVEFWKYRYFN